MGNPFSAYDWVGLIRPAHSLHFKETAFFDIKKEIEIDLAVEENIMPMCGTQFIYGLRILPKRK